MCIMLSSLPYLHTVMMYKRSDWFVKRKTFPRTFALHSHQILDVIPQEIKDVDLIYIDELIWFLEKMYENF